MARLLSLFLALWPALAFAQDGSRNYVSLLLFWVGATVVMALVGRVVFREQLHERHTLRRLTDELSPRFPEFDVVFLRTWVERAAPHVFAAWSGRPMNLGVHATDAFLARLDGERQALMASGERREARLGRLLKLHFLGLVQAGEGPAPTGVELLLRLEVEGEYRRLPVDAPALKSADRQLQFLFVLRHDGFRFRLADASPLEGDLVDLGRRVAPPPVSLWKRPKNEGGPL